MKKQSILIVDDSADMLELQRTLLESDGYNVLTAQSGAEALEILSQTDDLDLILLDLQMEDMSGPAFLNRVEEEWPWKMERLPVVFLSGADSPPTSTAVGYIKKFPDIDTFLALVRRFIRGGNASASPLTF